MADVRPELLGLALLGAGRDRYGKRASPRARVDVPIRRQREVPDDTPRSGWRDVRDRSIEPRLGAGPENRPGTLALLGAGAGRLDGLLRQAQPRVRDPRRSTLQGQRPSDPRGTRRDHRRRDLGGRGSRLPQGLLQHRRAPDRQGHGRDRHRRSGVRHARLHRCL